MKLIIHMVIDYIKILILFLVSFNSKAGIFDFLTGKDWCNLDHYSVVNVTKENCEKIKKAKLNNEKIHIFCAKKTTHHIAYFGNGDEVYELYPDRYLECLNSNGSSEKGRKRPKVSYSRHE